MRKLIQVTSVLILLCIETYVLVAYYSEKQSGLEGVYESNTWNTLGRCCGFEEMVIIRKECENTYSLHSRWGGDQEVCRELGLEGEFTGMIIHGKLPFSSHNDSAILYVQKKTHMKIQLFLETTAKLEWICLYELCLLPGNYFTDFYLLCVILFLANCFIYKCICKRTPVRPEWDQITVESRNF